MRKLEYLDKLDNMWFFIVAEQVYIGNPSQDKRAALGIAVNIDWSELKYSYFM